MGDALILAITDFTRTIGVAKRNAMGAFADLRRGKRLTPLQPAGYLAGYVQALSDVGFLIQGRNPAEPFENEVDKIMFEGTDPVNTKPFWPTDD